MKNLTQIFRQENRQALKKTAINVSGDSVNRQCHAECRLCFRTSKACITALPRLKLVAKKTYSRKTFSHNKTTITALKNHWAVRLLHWGTVMAILVGVGSIILRETVEEYSYQTKLLELHRQMGVLVLLFVAIRLQVNYLIDKPKHKPLPLFLRLCGGVCHTILYSLMITLPLLGIGVTNAHNVKVSFLGLGKLPSLVSADSELANTLTNYHSLESWVLLGAVVLHISSALIHHYVFKDEVLSAMLFDKKDLNFPSMGNGNGARNNLKGGFWERVTNKIAQRHLVRLFGKGA